jgi:hypothetical protein
MSNVLTLNQPQVAVGLQTFTFTVPSTVPGGYTGGGVYNAQVQVTFPEAVATGTSAGSGSGLGAGAGGGGEGFTGGDLGTGHGGVGQGFGPGNGYQQPPTYISTNAQGPSVSSDLQITVVDTTSSTTIYTSTLPTVTQSSLQFKVYFQPAIGDTITITFTSSNASDKVLNGLISQVTISQGLT